MVLTECFKLTHYLNWAVAALLPEFQAVINAHRTGLPGEVWWDMSPHRTQEIADLNLTRPLVLGELPNLKPEHHRRGPEKDDWEADRCVVHKFRYPLRSGVDACVKIGMKEHPKKAGIYIAKIYSFKRWK